MPLIHVNRAAQQTTGTGTGDVLLAAPLPGHQRIYTAIENLGITPENEMFMYLLEDANGTDWELGYGTFSITDPFDPDATTSLVRAPVESTALGSAITLTAGTHTVRVVPVAMQAPAVQGTGSEIGARAEGLGSIALGNEAQALVGSSIAIGAGAAASNEGSMCIGHGSASNADHVIAIGPNTLARIPGALTLGSGATGTPAGDAFVWSGKATTSGTTVSAVQHTTAAGSAGIEISDGMVIAIDVLIVGQRTAPSAARAGFRLSAVVYSASGADAILGSVTKSTIAVTGGAAPDANLTISGGNLQISVQGGAAGETWHWASAVVGALQVGGA